jgi:hypothetical protein
MNTQYGLVVVVIVIVGSKNMNLFLSLSLCGSAALWTLGTFQFLNPIHSRQDSLHWGSAHRKAATYTQDNINTE